MLLPRPLPQSYHRLLPASATLKLLDVHVSGLQRYRSFPQGLMSHSRVSSGLSCIVTYSRISFLSDAQSVSWHQHGTFPVSIRSSEDTQLAWVSRLLGMTLWGDEGLTHPRGGAPGLGQLRLWGFEKLNAGSAAAVLSLPQCPGLPTSNSAGPVPPPRFLTSAFQFPLLLLCSPISIPKRESPLP